MNKFLHESLNLIGLELSSAQQAAFDLYLRELEIWNARHNLTGIRDPEMVHIKHFLDSLTCLLAMRGTPMSKVIDVGTGAGFPGIPLKIVCPGIQLTLVESVGKKASFCRHMVETLNLDGVVVFKERAEVVGQLPEHREAYDWVIARAVANMPVLMELLLPLVKIGGRALAQKGERGPAETQDAEHAITLLGGHLRQIIPVTLPGVTEDRYLVIIDKIAATPEKYPRRIGIPSKRPLRK